MLTLAEEVGISADISDILFSRGSGIYPVMLDPESQCLSTNQNEVAWNMGEKLEDNFSGDRDFRQSDRFRTLHS
ncbi:hypothetical protein TK5_25570 [Sideroxyarcus sp. TK5]